jgi:hypothetical protein
MGQEQGVARGAPGDLEHDQAERHGHRDADGGPGAIVEGHDNE